MPVLIAQLLFDLGSTPDEVAAALVASGIKGVPNAARQLNIIVRYVQSRLSEDVLSVDLMQGNVLRVLREPREPAERIALPAQVVEFLHAFDHGGYPHLELPP